MKIENIIKNLETAKSQVENALQEIQDQVVHMLINDGIVTLYIQDAHISGEELVVDFYSNGDPDMRAKRIPLAVFEAENPLEAYKKFLVDRKKREAQISLAEWQNQLTRAQENIAQLMKKIES